MAKFLTLWLHQPSLMLEKKQRGIHLWLFWIISSAQFCISIAIVSAARGDILHSRIAVPLACRLAEFKGKILPAGKAPHCLGKRQACTSEGQVWSWVCRWDKPLQAFRGFWPHSIPTAPWAAGCSGEQRGHGPPAQRTERAAGAAQQDSAGRGRKQRLLSSFLYSLCSLAFERTIASQVIWHAYEWQICFRGNKLAISGLYFPSWTNCQRL